MRRLVPLGLALVFFSSPALASAPVRTVAGGCGDTSLQMGPLPPWAAPAMAGSHGLDGPFALSAHRDVLAYLFGHPLRAGHPRGRQNKVLWIMRLPRRGRSLHLTARPLHASRPVVRATLPADASPGEIYPSYVNVPRAGCWRVTLRWAGHTDEMALRYS